MSGPDDNARQRLKDFLEERAKELGLKLTEVAERAGFSTTVLRYVRNDWNQRVTPEVAKAIDVALDWEPGSVEAILKEPNGMPTPREDEANVSGSVVQILTRWVHRLKPSDYAQLSRDLNHVWDAAHAEGLRKGRSERPVSP